MTKYTWAAPVDGDYSDAADWSPQGVPDSADNVSLTARGTYTVTVSENGAANTVLVGAGATLDVDTALFTVGSAVRELSIDSGGEVKVENGATLSLLARSPTAQGDFNANTQTIDGVLDIDSGGKVQFGPSVDGASTTISGGGKLLLNGGELGADVSGELNVSTEIMGDGNIYLNELSNFNMSGTVDADTSGKSLTISGGGH